MSYISDEENVENEDLYTFKANEEQNIDNINQNLNNSKEITSKENEVTPQIQQNIPENQLIRPMTSVNSAGYKEVNEKKKIFLSDTLGGKIKK
jgi:hypothetical protein